MSSEIWRYAKANCKVAAAMRMNMIMPVVLIVPMKASVSIRQFDRAICLISTLSYSCACPAALSADSRNAPGSNTNNPALRAANAPKLSQISYVWFITAMTKAPLTPAAAASVGVAQPP